MAKARLDVLGQSMENHLNDLTVDSLGIPRSVDENGNTIGVKSRDWTSGFFAGTLWMLGESTNSDKLLDAAADWTKFQIKEQFDDHTHDLGFKIYNSLGKAKELGGVDTYDDDIIQASTTLIDRYDPDVRTIRSWDWGKKKGWIHPTIIDNMMNLEMLFETTKMTGDSTYWMIAENHADRTLQEHFRPNASSYHVVDYDPETGEVRSRVTHQGISDDSEWARGQAWGLYGYTMAYRLTGKTAYLDQAKRIAEFFFTHPNMPADHIPYFDFSASPGEDTPRDVSAGALAASAVIELAQYAPSNQAKYIRWADQVLATLERPEYQTTQTPFLLDKSTGNYPDGSEINVPINYGDYYYVEALRRRAAIADDVNSTPKNDS